MYPCVTPHVEFQNYCHLRVSESNSSAGATVIVGDKGARFESRSIKDILIAGKATNMYKMLQEYYEVRSRSHYLWRSLSHSHGAGSLLALCHLQLQQDPFYGSPQEYLKPPPVDSIKAIYGVNLPTEIAYFFREANSGSSGGSSDCVTALCLDNDGSIPNYKCEGD